METQAFVYFLTNKYNNVLYRGVTNNIIRRVAEHKVKVKKGYVNKYNCDKLVYYEQGTLISSAIVREKQLKNWKREWKNTLVNDFNPEWRDLSEDIGVTNEIVEYIRKQYKEIADQVRNDERGGLND
jgi:putative endonuclease